MAVAIRGSTPATASVSGAGTPSLTLTGTRQPQANDVLLIIHGNDYYLASNMSTPTVGGSTTGVTAVTGGSADGGNLFGHVKSYTYVVGSAGDLTVATVETGLADEEKCLAVYVLSGVDTSTPVDVAAGNFNSGAGNQSHVAPSVSPTSSNAYLICHSNDANGGDGGASTPPSGMTEQYDSTAGGFMSFTGATVQLSSSGATGTKTFTSVGNSTFAAISVAMKTASAATASYPPQRARSREAPPLRVAKTRQTTPVRGQVNPPYPTQEVDQTRRLRGMLARRGEIRSVTPPQFNPPFPFVEVHPARQLRGLLSRRGRLASPVPAQVVLTPPPYPPQVIRVRPKILRWFRGRGAQPIPPPVVVTPPTFVPDRSHRTRLFAWVRREHPAVPLAAPDVPAGLKRDRPNLPTPRRPKMAVPVPAQTVPPPRKPARHPVAPRLRHGGFVALPLKQQLPPVNPAFVAAITRRRVLVLPTRRGRYAIPWTSACDCRAHRPNGGITTRPSSGTTAYSTATTARPTTGATTRPAAGVTTRPCNC